MKKAFEGLRVLAFMALLCAGWFSASAQQVAIKTNLLSDALLNINLGAEVEVAPKWSVELTGQLNDWNMSHNRRWKHWALQPEGRYWFCNTFDGHFLGAHIHGGQYNIGGLDLDLNFLGTDFSKLKDSRYQGWFVGAGISYGYDWILNEHWNIEAEIGIGWSYTRYDQFRCAGCGKKIAEGRHHNYVGLTRVALNIVYLY